ncbi:MAG: Rid family hydrolase [bacterium]
MARSLYFRSGAARWQHDLPFWHDCYRRRQYLPVPGNIEKQTRQIFRKFDRLLRVAGGSCENIVATTDFFITTENYNRPGKVRGEFLRDARLTATGVTSVLRRAA